jgi:hypothetical protein
VILGDIGLSHVYKSYVGILNDVMNIKSSYLYKIKLRIFNEVRNLNWFQKAVSRQIEDSGESRENSSYLNLSI